MVRLPVGYPSGLCPLGACLGGWFWACVGSRPGAPGAWGPGGLGAWGPGCLVLALGLGLGLFQLWGLPLTCFSATGWPCSIPFAVVHDQLITVADFCTFSSSNMLSKISRMNNKFLL